MLVNVEFSYEQTWQRKSAGVVFSFYPNSVTEVEIKEPSADEFPLVAIVASLKEKIQKTLKSEAGLCAISTKSFGWKPIFPSMNCPKD